MIGMLIEAQRALIGVIMMLGFRPGFEERFDTSAEGMARSFLAALIAIPVLAFSTAGHNFLAEAVANDLDPALPPRTLLPEALRWFLAWAYFPILAAVVTRMVDRREAFSAWLVAHNWTHLLLVMVQMISVALLVTGQSGLGALTYLVSLGLLVFAYLRVAFVSLSIAPPIAAVAGMLNVIAAIGLSRMINALFYPPAA